MLLLSTAQTFPGKTYIYYKVQPGDSLYSIAKENHIFRAALYAANGIDKPEKYVLSPGTVLRLPKKPYVTRKAERAAMLQDLADKYHVPLKEVAELNGIDKPEAYSVYAGQTLKIPKYYFRKYEIRKGDVLSIMAEEARTPLSELCRVNGIEDPQKYVLNVGETILAPKQAYLSYTVRAGDSPSGIAQRFGIDMDDLYNINGVDDGGSYVLIKGRSIKIPLKEDAPYKKELHKIVKGNTLYSIARDGGISLKELCAANGIKDPSSYVLKIGSSLRVPSGIYYEEMPDDAQTLKDKTKGNDSSPQRSGVSPRILNIKTIEIASISGGSSKPTDFTPDFALKQDTPSFVWPYDGRITRHFEKEGSMRHSGINIQTPESANIRCASDGTVQFSGRLRGYGNVVIIKHSGGFNTIYARLGETYVEQGDYVEKNKVIAKTDIYGNSSELHFKIVLRGKPLNPLPLLN